MRQFLGAIFLLVSMALPVGAEQVADAFGRSVGGEGAPQRIVSLVPAVTEILFAFGLEERIVGVTRACNYPPAARTKTKVGEYASPNLEMLAVLQPDLLFMDADSSGPELLHRLEALRIPVYIAYPRSVGETAKLIRSLGRLLERQVEAEAMASELDQAVACARRLTAELPRSRVLCTVMSQPLVVAGRNTLLDDLVTIAGGENVVPPGANRYPTWGIEAVLASDPEVILVSPHPGQPDPAVYFRRWPTLQAVKNERLVAINADWIQRPGPRLVQGLAALAKALHGVDVTSQKSSCRE